VLRLFLGSAVCEAQCCAAAAQHRTFLKYQGVLLPAAVVRLPYCNLFAGAMCLLRLAQLEARSKGQLTCAATLLVTVAVYS
jgi:hypothetical protein